MMLIACGVFSGDYIVKQQQKFCINYSVISTINKYFSKYSITKYCLFLAKLH